MNQPITQTTPFPTTLTPSAPTAGKVAISKMLTDLINIYANDELKLSAEFYGVMEIKLKLFYEMCGRYDLYSVCL